MLKCRKCTKSAGWVIDGLCDPCYKMQNRGDGDKGDPTLIRAVYLLERLYGLVSGLDDDALDYMAILDVEKFLNEYR